MSVKSYSFKSDSNKFLSQHFQVKEFASISGNKLYTDKVLIDSSLISMLENLYERLECTSIIVNSGYRCSNHDKSVGGNGYGQHTKGTAADIVCRNKNGIINAKIVCCVAHELGFGGVANISAKYQSVHVDVRAGSKYRGDEIRGTNSIWKYNSKWTDFYKYWGISKSEISKYLSDKPVISVGDTVMVSNGACTYDGKKLASFVFKNKYKVSQIKGDRAVICQENTVIAAVNVRNLKKV